MISRFNFSFAFARFLRRETSGASAVEFAFAMPLQLGAWKSEACRVAAFGCPLDGRTSWIRKSQQPRHFVEGLTRRIIQETIQE